MKKACISALLMAALMGLLFSSCKSTPKPDETPKPVEKPKEKLSLDELNSAAAGAAAARKLAVDFEAPAYFPSDWEEAESQYGQAGSKPKSTEAEVQAAIAAYKDVTGVYTALFDKTIPLYAQAREDEIVAARDALIATGIAPTWPDYLSGADKTALGALAQYEAKDYYGAKDQAATALAMYQILTTGANAYLVREEILSRDFASIGQEDFDRAEEVGQAAIDAYEAGDLAAAADNADEALLRYNLVLNAGWAACIADLEAAAIAERQNAIAYKANVAARNVFNAANTLFDQAAALRKEEKYADSAALYAQAGTQFADSARIAEEKRALAEEAIREAEEKIEASDEAARQAEIIIGGDQNE